jgi:hypothetical protein
MKKVLVSLMFIMSACLYSQKEQAAFSEAIEDNSFLIEEAYNQEDRVVQHIFNLMYYKEAKSFMFGFTQEWPFFAQAHQLSYTLTYASILDGFSKGIGDFMLNYRYQLTGHDDFITTSPRFSLILPTGDEKKGLGDGVIGFEAALPMSKRLHEYFTLHANVGFKYLPGIKTYDFTGSTSTEVKMDKSTFFAGASLIALPIYNLNIMLEGIFYNETTALPSISESSQSYILNPGLRYAWDIGDLQVVPGLAFPIVISKGSSPQFNMFFYLSLEHPF